MTKKIIDRYCDREKSCNAEKSEEIETVSHYHFTLFPAHQNIK